MYRNVVKVTTWAVPLTNALVKAQDAVATRSASLIV